MRKRFTSLMLLIGIFLLSFVLNVSALAQGSASFEEKLQPYLEESLPANSIPNASVIVVNPDKTIYVYNKGNNIDSDEQFIIGSMSKSFTALAIMQLVEQGLIDLDAPISDYLPKDTIPTDIATKVTVKQLLNQDSGIHAYYSDDIKKLYTQGEFYYSNANFSLAGEIVEAVSEIQYGDYVQKNIFEPLNMNNSTASVEMIDKGEGIAQGYRVFFGFPVPSKLAWNKKMIPHGYIVSTANDMGNYLQMWLNNGEYNGKRIISQTSIDQIFEKAVLADQDTDGYYGMGWGMQTVDGISYTNHGGNVETYSSFMNILPEQNIAFAMLFSVDDMLVGQNISTQINMNVVKILSGEMVEPVTSSLYWQPHIIINFCAIVVILLCLLPIIFLKRWKKKASLHRRRTWIALILLHVLVPIGIFVILFNLGYPPAVIIGFGGDIFLVAVTCAILLLAEGIYKIMYLIRHSNS